jgi:ribosomal protein S1
MRSLKTSNMKRKIILIVIITGMLISGIAYWQYNKTHKDIQTVDADFVTSAGDLVAEFTVDETSAEAKYNGKIMEVSGMIKEITDSGVILDGNDEMTGVLAVLETSQELSGLKVGQNVTVRGMYTGKLIDIELGRCQIINP